MFLFCTSPRGADAVTDDAAVKRARIGEVLGSALPLDTAFDGLLPSGDSAAEDVSHSVVLLRVSFVSFVASFVQFSFVEFVSLLVASISSTLLPPSLVFVGALSKHLFADLHWSPCSHRHLNGHVSKPDLGWPFRRSALTTRG